MKPNSSDKFAHCYSVDLHLFDPGLELINFKPVVKNKLNELLSKLQKFKVQTILVLEYKKINYLKIFQVLN